MGRAYKIKSNVINNGYHLVPELVRVIRKIAQVYNRIYEIKIEIANLKKSELHELKTRAENAEIEGRDLLAELPS